MSDSRTPQASTEAFNRRIDPDLLTLDRRLQAMVNYGKEQPRNGSATYFCSVTNYPLNSVTITFDDDHNDNEEHDGHLVWNVEPEDDHIFNEPPDFDPVAFSWFENNMTNARLSFRISYDKFKRKMQEMINIINRAIKLDHEILCHRDGRKDDAPLKDKVLLHVADVIVLFVQDVKRQLGPAKFWLQTNGSHSVNTLRIDNPFVRSLTEQQKRFLFYNADFFYIVYAYWGNYSILPCRMEVPAILEKASILYNDERFKHHQEGKLEQLSREQRRMPDKSHFMF